MPTSAYWEHLTRSAILETELSKHYSLALFSFSDPYTCPFLLLPTHQRQVLTVCLLTNVFHPFTEAIAMKSMLFKVCAEAMASYGGPWRW